MRVRRRRKHQESGEYNPYDDAEPQDPAPSLAPLLRGVSDGIRTRDRLDHNQELYLLSYAHHGAALSGDVRNLAVGSG